MWIISVMVSMIRVGTLRIRQSKSFCCWGRSKDWRKDWRRSNLVMNTSLLILGWDSGWRIKKRILSANAIEVGFANFAVHQQIELGV